MLPPMAVLGLLHRQDNVEKIHVTHGIQIHIGGVATYH
jgi:hypothetical protein